MMLRRFITTALLLATATLVGCAHPISLNPDLGKLKGGAQDKAPQAIGLNLSAADLQREVTGPGGGGDKVSYLPYRDLEPGLYLALGEVFAKVNKVSGSADPKVASEGLNYVFSPKIATTSFSPSLFTWPPTVFTIEISGPISNAQGKVVDEVRVMGDGRAEFEEFKGDFSLSAKRAADDVLAKLIKALREAATRLSRP
jgi:hypothetical protein